MPDSPLSVLDAQQRADIRWLSEGGYDSLKASCPALAAMILDEMIAGEMKRLEPCVFMLWPTLETCGRAAI